MNGDKGLLGLLRVGAANARKGLFNALSLFESSLVRIFVFLVVGAAIISVIEHVGSKAASTLDWYRLAMLGMGAILAELIGMKRLITYWHQARAGSMIAWSGVWIVGFAFAFYNAVGTSANTAVNKANVQKAAHQSSVNVNADLETARNKLKAEEKTLVDVRQLTYTALPMVDGTPMESVAQAQAKIAGFKANTRFWEELTDHCTKTGGKETRKFCKDYNDAVAAVAALDERKGWAGSLVAAEAAVEKARANFLSAQATANNTKTEVSEIPPFVAQVAYWSGQPAERVMWMESAQVSLVNMLLVSFAGIVLGLASIEGKPRTKWINWARIARLWWGDSSKAVTTPADSQGNVVAATDVAVRRLRTMSGRLLASA